MTTYAKLKIVLIIVLALIVSLFTYKYLSSLKDEITVIVAAQDIDERKWITREMVKEVSIRSRDKQVLAPNAVTSIDEINNAISKQKIKKGSVINKKENIISGSREWMINNNIIDENGQINDAYFIGENERIVTIRLDSQGAVDNRLKKGDWVDIIFTYSSDVNSFSVTLLQHIQIYDLDPVSGNGDASQNISLIVTPQQAVDLVYAKRNGKIDLALNPEKGENSVVYPSNIRKIIDSFNTQGN